MPTPEQRALVFAVRALLEHPLEYWVRNATDQGRWHVRAPIAPPPRPDGEPVLYRGVQTPYAA